MQSEKGMTVGVYRGPYESTNGGQSSSVRNFTVVGWVGRRAANSDKLQLVNKIDPMPLDMQVFVPNETAPPAILVAGAFRGCPPKLVPLDTFDRMERNKLVGPMAGGNKADSSDSRWRELVSGMIQDDVGGAPTLYISTVDIHDRVETQAQYNALSI